MSSRIRVTLTCRAPPVATPDAGSSDVPRHVAPGPQVDSVHEPAVFSPASPDRHRQCGGRADRVRAQRRGPEHDQHRHRQCRGHRHSGGAARACGQRTGARHRQHPRGRRRRTRDRGAAGRGRAASAAGGRLSLQRPHPAARVSRDGAPARQVPHQPRQRGGRAAARRQLRHHDRGRPRVRQTGAHRRQLGQPRPERAGPPDGRERPARQPQERHRRDDRRDGHVCPGERPLRRGTGAGARQDPDLGQGVERARAVAGVPPAGRAVRLPAAPRSDRGRHGHEGHRGEQRGAGAAAHRGHRRHHPGEPDARARRAAQAGGRSGPADPAVARAASVSAAGHELPRLRAHHLAVLSGTRAEDSGLHPRHHARVEGPLPRRRGDAGGGDGLHRQRPRREQARQHRDLAAGHR